MGSRVLLLTACLALAVSDTSGQDVRRGGGGQGAIFIERLRQDGNLLWGCDIVLAASNTSDPLSGQRFRVLLDTGSSDLWLASKSCDSRACVARKRFDPARASQLEFSNNRTITLNYGADSEVTGVEVRARLQIAGLAVERQSFLLAARLEGRVFNSFKFDGVLGLGTKFLSRLKALTPVEQMVKQRLIPRPLFAVHLNPAAYLDEQVADGELRLGSLHGNYSHRELKNVSLETNMRWQFRLTSISLRTRCEDFQKDGPPRVVASVCTRPTSCSALVDTGTPLIRGPRREIGRLNEHLGATQTPSGLFAFPNCSVARALPNLVFAASPETELELEPRDYVLERPAAGAPRRLECYSALAVQQEYPFWILGNVFLARFYTAFDLANNRLGFVRVHEDLRRKYNSN